MSRLSNHELEARVAEKLRAYIVNIKAQLAEDQVSLSVEDKIPGKEFSIKDKLDAAAVVADYLERLSRGEFNINGFSEIRPKVYFSISGDADLANIIYEYVAEAYPDLNVTETPAKHGGVVFRWIHGKISRIFILPHWHSNRTKDCVAGCNQIYIPSSTQEIWQAAFEGRQIKKLVVSDSVSKIEACAFSDCGITELVLGSSVQEIEQYAFSGCPIERLMILGGPDMPVKIGANAFDFTHLKLVVAPLKLRSILAIPPHVKFINLDLINRVKPYFEPLVRLALLNRTSLDYFKVEFSNFKKGLPMYTDFLDLLLKVVRKSFALPAGLEEDASSPVEESDTVAAASGGGGAGPEEPEHKVADSVRNPHKVGTDPRVFIAFRENIFRDRLDKIREILTAIDDSADDTPELGGGANP